MSTFACEHCGVIIQDTPNGYVTHCEHYPADSPSEVDFGPQRGPSSLSKVAAECRSLHELLKATEPPSAPTRDAGAAGRCHCVMRPDPMDLFDRAKFVRYNDGPRCSACGGSLATDGESSNVDNAKDRP